ncbi:MAG: hypothetical protein D6819_09795 [Gammaproteobacteria bacterium]|nr:MAG: hypothetical protein D6819_09795 [Gammaproteobacteria bacterium]
METPASPPIAESIDFEWAGETIRRVGTVVHRMLHRIGQEGLGRWGKARIDAHRPYYRHALLRLGVSKEELDRAAEQVRQALLKTLSDPRGRWILGQEGHCEYPVAGLYRGQVVSAVIDRTFVEGGVRWIIDYKASAHEGGDIEAFLDQEQERYRGQLERYAVLMAAMDPGPIRLGLYFPLLQGWREFPFRGSTRTDMPGQRPSPA